ncbi:MAG TPA: glycine--tRNA ligase [Candidatus Staskawiczbacteria bacterium]|nr:glycine--tRNA ligase [Candidatus Staskawiczbacteria bacterium]
MKKQEQNDLMEKIISLCKRRGFVFPGSEIYGGLANSWDYGPLGVELKNNIKAAWWKKFVQQRDDMVGLDAALIMNPKVWENSGHLKNFSDPLVECKKCHHRFREDQLQDKSKCPDCGGEFLPSKQFNLMLKTFLGPVEDENAIVYFRPETAQAIFVDFKNVLQTSRKKLPFGIAQIGKAFRNEITPGNFIFRTREFEQMEIEYFVKPEEWEAHFESLREDMWSWMTDTLGLKKENIVENDIAKEELAHYSTKTIDFEYRYPFGQKELYGMAYRTDFDLKNHFAEPPYDDPDTKEKFYPHVIEPSLGVDRSVLAVLLDAYMEDGDRIVLKLKPSLAPIKVAVSCIKKNDENLVSKAKEIYQDLKKDFSSDFDNRGNIGKFYYSQDEIGTPYCVTVDFQTLEDNTVTIRHRDTAEQERVKIEDLKNNISLR